MKKLLVPYSEYICTVQEYRGWDSRFDIQLWSDGQALPSSSITQACEILYYLKSVTFHQIPDLWGPTPAGWMPNICCQTFRKSDLDQFPSFRE